VLRAVTQSSMVAGWRTIKNDWEEPLQSQKLTKAEICRAGFRLQSC
jgi:hypothetical protein